MKKYILISLFLILLIPFAACGNQNNKIDPVVERAYNHLDSQSKDEIVAWEHSTVTVIDYSKQQSHEVINLNTNQRVDLKDKMVYRVTFKVKDSTILGDIDVYVDKKTNEVLGVDMRE